MLLITSSVNGPPVCPVANVTCHVAVGGEITSIVLAFAVPTIDFEVTAITTFVAEPCRSSHC